MNMRPGQISALLLVGLCLLTGCGSCDRFEGPPNVVIITMDTVRTDHLGCYGYPVDTTPELDALAEGATRYAHCVATSSWTIPTHASFFTGKYAFEHGAHAFEVESAAANNINRLPMDELTLAEVLLGEGYETGAFVANDGMLGARWQLDQGFLVYHVQRLRAPELNEKVFGWLDRLGDEPFLLFVNYIDAHRPYNCEPVPGLLPRPVVQDEGELVLALYDEVMAAGNPPSPGLRQQVVDQYDTALRHIDTAVGALIAKLKSLDRFENTVFVVTSDHGEFFGEHLLVEHSKDVYEEVLSIPLIIRYPGQSRGRVETDLASATDLPHLILSAFSGEIWDGHRRAFPDAPGNHDVIGELYYTRTKDLFHPLWGHRFQRVRTAYYDWPYKYVDSSDGAFELYDLEADPAEAVNLIGRDEDTAERLIEGLRRFMKTRARSERLEDRQPLSEDELRRLRSLGYVGD